MDIYVIVLRILHIAGGVFWAGAVLVTLRFVLPNARQIGPAGGAFVGRLMGEQGLSRASAGAAVITILSGVLLYWHDFGEIVPFNASMAGFAVGGLAALTLWLIGILGFLPANRRLAALAARAAAGDDVGPEMAAATAGRDRLVPWMVGLMSIAVLAMAVSRYL
jgi:hypothetical protein